ncbi:MAG: hypothetical protein KA149_03440 [Chitinophagales bacterium]|nr:hypothetical protein [Chitinophagales bacterium]
MRAINPQRKKFCRLLAGGESGAGAYRKAYKNKNSITCKTNAHRLVQQPNVLIYLTMLQGSQPQAQEPPKAANTPVDQPAPKRARAKTFTVTAANVNRNYRVYPSTTGQEAQLLTQVMRGKAYLTKYKVIKGQWVLIPITPKPRQIIRCIRQLNKMDGSYAPIKRKRKKPRKALIKRRLH